MSRVASMLNKVQGMVSGMDIGSILSRPSIGVPAVYFGGRFAAEDIVAPVVGSIWDKLKGGPQKRMRNRYEFEREGILQQLQAQMVEERQARDIKINAMRLIEQDPHLAQEVLLGRKLPRGATVIGYRPRVDLLQELAAGMAGGQFSTATPAADRYMQAAGGAEDDMLAGL